MALFIAHIYYGSRAGYSEPAVGEKCRKFPSPDISFFDISCLKYISPSSVSMHNAFHAWAAVAVATPELAPPVYE